MKINVKYFLFLGFFLPSCTVIRLLTGLIVGKGREEKPAIIEVSMFLFHEQLIEA